MYNLPVKIEGLEKRKRSSGILHMLAGMFIVVTGSKLLRAQGNEFIWLQVIMYVVGVSSMVYGAVRKKIDKQAKYNQWFRLAQMATFLMKGFVLINYEDTITVISLFVWAGVTLLLWFSEKKVFKATELGLSKEGISVPGYYTEHQIPWTLVNDLVVRPDFVTITRENMSYVQLELLADIDRVQINRINEFAREQLTLHKKTEQTS